MKAKGTKTVDISELKENLFVRKQIDPNRVIALAELIESGVAMADPIEVTEDLVIVDGRHRKEAYFLNDVKTVEVKILWFETESEMIAYAYRANAGGSLPPTKEDTEHTVMLLLDLGESKKRIGDLLGLPAGLARKYAKEVQSKVSRQKLLQAAAAVTEGGLTVNQAANQYGVDPDKLKEVLSGHRRKHKQGVAEVQRGLTKTYKSLGAKHAALLRNLFEKYEDGDVTVRQVREIFTHLERLQKLSARKASDWQKRFEAMLGKGNATAEKKAEKAA